MQAFESLIVGGRPLDSTYGTYNSSVPPAALPAPDPRFSSFRLQHSPTDPRLPVILGAGALFGPVISGHLLDDNQPVAIKTFLTLKDEYDRQFLETHATHEYRRGATDLGPHFVRARSLVESLDRDSLPVFMLVMDLVEGATLESLIGSAISVQQQQTWLGDALQALRTMAAHHLIQQDIKPANIMSADRGLVFIDHGSSRAPQEGTHINDQRTLAFLAPEYWSTETFTLETMIFGIGLTLLEVITGGKPYIEPPFNRDTATDNTEFLRRTRVGTLNLNHPSLDSGVASVIAIMTAQDPHRRTAVLGHNSPHDPDQTAPQAQTSVAEPVSVQNLAGEKFQPVSSANVPKSIKSEAREPVAAFALQMPPQNPAKRNALIDLAGVDSTAVHDNERRHYSAIGLALIVYLVYIVLGVFAFAHQVSDDLTTALWAAAIVGPLLGAALVNFDRSIVNSIRPNLSNLRDPTEPPLLKGGWGYSVNILVRVIATILIAFLIGSAVDVELHRRDVMPIVAEEQAAMRTTLDNEVAARFGERQKDVKKQLSDAKKEQSSAQGRGEKLRKAAKKERQGKGATGIKGCGPRCQQLLDDATEADKAYIKQSEKLQDAVDKAADASTTLASEITEFKKPELERIQQATGPIAQAKALWNLSLRDTYTMVTNIGLIAVFMVIELFAVAMKLATSGNAYERAQGARARLRALIDQETTETQQADIVGNASANRQLQDDERAVEVLRRTLDLEATASSLYTNAAKKARNADGAGPMNGHTPNGAPLRASLAPTLVMLTDADAV